MNSYQIDSKEEIKSEIIKPSFRDLVKKWLPLVVLSLALAIVVIDGTVLNVSISYIQKDLNTNIKNIQWTITLYSLVLVAFTITGGKLGDIFGRKKMFILGAILFAIGSLIASFAQNIQTLIFGWSVIEGLGAAMMIPATTSLVVSLYHGKDRAIAFGVWGGIAGAAAALGPILGGYLTTDFSWNWAFRINVFIVLILVLGSVTIKEAKVEEKPKLDYVGVILSGFGLSSLVYGIIESSTYGWFKAKETYVLNNQAYYFPFDLSITPVTVLAGILVLSVFVWWLGFTEKRGNIPLIRLSIFKNIQFNSGLLVTTLMSLGMTGIIFSIPIFYQNVLEYTAFKTGLGLLPMSLSLLISAPVSAILSRKINPKIIIQAGLLIDIIGIFILRQSLSSEANISNLAPGLILFGLGMGMASSILSNLTLSAVSVSQAGEASGVNFTSRQLGQTFGSAILGAVFLTSSLNGLTNQINQSRVISDLQKPMLIEQSKNQNENSNLSNPKKEQINPTILKEINLIKNQSVVDGTKDVLTYTIFFAIFAFGSSFLLPNKSVSKNSPKEEIETNLANSH
jgi:EmrB/QacA subfamily drug resistance transporter